MDPLQLTLAQQYEAERMNRLIDSMTNAEDLRAMCKKLLGAWMTQKAATTWVMRQSISAPPTIRNLE